MRFSVRHETLYRYSVPVALAPHVLRLNPRADGVRMLAASLIVDPAPVARHDSTDRFGNRVTHVSFDGLSDLLRIESRFDLEIPAAAPLSDPGLPPLPWPPSPGDGLGDYLLGGPPDPAVAAFASALASESGWAALPFLQHLNETLFTRLDRGIRVEGAAQAPAYTLATGGGACRDITVLFMAACRSLGIAARFVSGYQAHADTPDGRRHLHAWPEVFLPGVGWRGFDPTHGTTVSDGHVALCAAPDQAGTTNGVTATMMRPGIKPSLETLASRAIPFGLAPSPHFYFVLQHLLGLCERHRQHRHIAKIKLGKELEARFVLRRKRANATRRKQATCNLLEHGLLVRRIQEKRPRDVPPSVRALVVLPVE